MSAESKMYTLEEVRTAFVRGATYGSERGGLTARLLFAEEGERRYPAPKKLREVEINGIRYRVVDGKIFYYGAFGWQKTLPQQLFVETLHDLFAHPYEEDK